MFNLLDMFKGLGLAGGAPQQFTGLKGLKQEHVTVDPPNLRQSLGQHVGGSGGTFVDMVRQGRRTGEMPGQPMGMGPAGANYNQATPEPMPFPQEAAGETPSLFANFDSEKFGKRLGRLGAGWAAGKNFNDSVRLGNMAMSFDEEMPDKRLRSLLWLMQQR